MPAAQALAPDLLLLALDPPRLDALQLCRDLKTNPKTRDIPIIFLTSATNPDERVSLLEAGAADYITKPFDLPEFQARIRSALKTSYLLDLLSKKAMIDGLTGLWNRQYFEQRLTAEISLARRSSRPVSCLLCQIDQYAQIIAKHSHIGADQMLRSVGHFLVNNCRIEDVI